MNRFIDMMSSDLAYQLGWTLLHSLWLGLLITLAMVATLMLIPKRRADLRYACSCIAMLGICTSIGVAIRLIPDRPFEAAPDQAPIILSIDPSIESLVEASLTATPFAATATESDRHPTAAGQSEILISQSAALSLVWRQRVIHTVQPWITWVAPVWLLGVLMLSIWHLGGYVTAHRLRTIGASPASEHARRVFDDLIQRLGVRQTVLLLQSTVVQSPAVIGWLRPVVLVPVSILSELPVHQLEAVFAHELAHIRRYDYLINLLQVIAETLLFHHPAVWWVSRQIRKERECCCDDIAVRLTADRLNYAQALTSIAALGQTRSQWTVAANGGSLLLRIQRIMGLSNQSPLSSGAWITSLLAVTVCVVALAATNVNNTPEIELNDTTDTLNVEEGEIESGEYVQGVAALWRTFDGGRKLKVAELKSMAWNVGEPSQQGRSAGAGASVTGEAVVSVLMTPLFSDTAYRMHWDIYDKDGDRFTGGVDVFNVPSRVTDKPHWKERNVVMDGGDIFTFHQGPYRYRIRLELWEPESEVSSAETSESDESVNKEFIGRWVGGGGVMPVYHTFIVDGGYINEIQDEVQRGAWRLEGDHLIRKVGDNESRSRIEWINPDAFHVYTENGQSWMHHRINQETGSVILWGEAVEGLAVRLRPEQQTISEKNKTAELQIDVLNEGQKAQRVSRAHRSLWLEVDGKWHQGPYDDSGLITTKEFQPGESEKVFLRIALQAGENKNWTSGYLRRDGTVPLRGGARLPAKPLVLTLGKHRIRLALAPQPPNDHRRGLAKLEFAYSNPVEIEIVAADEVDNTDAAVDVSITGQVVGLDGQPAVGYRVTALPEKWSGQHGWPPTTYTDENGAFVFHKLPDGPCDVAVTSNPKTNQPNIRIEGVVLKKGKPIDVHLSLEQRFTFGGRVIAAAGEPQPDRNVLAIWKDPTTGAQYSSNTKTDVEGRYRFTSPFEVAERVLINDGNFKELPEHQNVRHGREDVDFQLAGTRKNSNVNVVVDLINAVGIQERPSFWVGRERLTREALIDRLSELRDESPTLTIAIRYAAKTEAEHLDKLRQSLTKLDIEVASTDIHDLPHVFAYENAKFDGTIRGTVVDSHPTFASPKYLVMLWRKDWETMSGENPSLVVGAGEAFEFRNVGPGDYELRTREWRPILHVTPRGNYVKTKMVVKEEKVAAAQVVFGKDHTGRWNDAYAWGEAVDGVRMRVTQSKFTIAPGQNLDLRVDIYNGGEVDLRIALEHESWEVELDGKWFKVTGGVEGRRRYLPLPAKQAQHNVEVWPWLWENMTEAIKELSPGKHTLRVARRLNGEGRLPNDAPPIRIVSQSVKIEISETDAQAQVKHTKNAFFTARVVDAETGELIEKFTALAGTRRMEDIGWQWQPHTIHKFAKGRMQWPPPGKRGYKMQVLRIEAQGYKSYQTPSIKRLDEGEERDVAGWSQLPAGDPVARIISAQPGKPFQIMVRLQRDPGVKGLAMSPNGQPAAGAQVAIAMAAREVRLGDGEIVTQPLAEDASLRDCWDRPFMTTTDDQGRFILPSEIAPAAVIITHASGIAAISFNDFSANGEVTLEPWGVLDGRVIWGDAPGAGTKIDIGARTRVAEQFQLVVWSIQSVVTDDEGRFRVEKLPPGLAQVSHVIDVPDKEGSSYRPVQFVEISSGEPTPFVLGGKGRPVVGKLVGAGNFNDVRVRIALNAPHPRLLSNPDDPTWPAYGQFLNSPAGENYAKGNIKVNADGMFRIENVPPESYQLFVSAPNADGKAENIGYAQFRIKTIPGGASDESHDLGELKVRFPTNATGKNQTINDIDNKAPKGLEFLAGIRQFRDFRLDMTEQKLREIVHIHSLEGHFHQKEEIRTYHLYASEGDVGENVIVMFRDGLCSGIQRMRPDPQGAKGLFKEQFLKRNESYSAHFRACKFLYEGGDRLEAAAKFRKIAQMAPVTETGARARELAKLLEQMAKEQRPEVDKLNADGDVSLEQAVEDLIFDLRDVAAQPFGVPGKCRVLSWTSQGFDPQRSNPAIRLRELAKDKGNARDLVISRLIQLLNDRRPTRSWATSLNGGHVLRNCDVALEILADVAGAKKLNNTTTFDPRTIRDAYLGNADVNTRKQIIGRVKSWWTKEQANSTKAGAGLSS